MESVAEILEKNDRRWLLDFLKSRSVKVSRPGEPEFNLASGGTSRFYIDVRQSALHADVHSTLAYALYTVLAHGTFGQVQAVAGVALGGCHLASITALYAIVSNARPSAGLHVVYVRKEPKDHGMKKLVESADLPKGTPIVLIEDVITSGRTSIKAIGELLKIGFDVRGVLAVIDRRPANSRTKTLLCEEKEYPLYSLYNLDDFQDMLE